jgi:tetratricopeptide (TPR) repeat protein
VRVDVTAALTTLELDGYASAAQLLSGAREQARTAAATDLVALTHIQQGVIDARSGSWAAARRQLIEAMRLSAHLGPVEQCSTLITLGYADLSLRHLDDAVSHLEQARAIAAEHGLEAHLFKATHNLGCVHFVAGDLPRALSLMTEAGEMTVEVARDRAQLDHAEALMDAGLIDEAGELLHSALDEARAAGHRLDEGDILLDLARCALLHEDLAGARRSAGQALRAFRARQAESREALAELFLVALDVADGGSPERALAAASRWRTEEPRSAGEVEATLLVAEAEVAAGRPERAAQELARLSPGVVRRLPVQIHEYYLRAVIAHERGDDAGFDDTVRAASDILAAAQSATQSLELRAALAQHASRLAQLDLSRAVGSRSPAACLDTVERWRAASARARALAIAPDPDTAGLLQELRWLSSAMSPASESESAGQEARIAQLQREIAARAWRRDRSDDASPATEAVTHDQLTELLPAGTAYLTFAEAAGEMYAMLALPHGDSALHHIGDRATVVAAVTAVRRDLRAAAFAHREPSLNVMVRRALRESCERLGATLLGPLQADVDDCERLVVAPNATLHAVPWSALPSLEHRPVTVTPSATRWARHRSARPIRLERASAHVGPGLTEAGDEARAIERIWTERGVRVEPTTGAATSERVARALARHDLVHVAAHGHHAGDEPLFSSLRLHDGPLFAHELVHEVGAQHVVLSACDIGQAQVRVGGEALGMTSALLAFGVRSVVAAVAPIGDEASAAASVMYHRELAGGADAATALSRAIARTPGAEPLVVFGSDVELQPVPSP